MGVKVTFNDNSGRLLAQMQGNARRALTAMGTKAVGLTVQKMQSGYGKPIRRTGDLMRSIAYEVENSGKNTVDVGSNLEYAPFVHEGTSRMAGRPYLRDALKDGSDDLEQVCAAYLRQGID